MSGAKIQRQSNLTTLPNKHRDSAGTRSPDENLFWTTAYQILTQSKGSPARVLILQRLEIQPINANRLAESLDLDYKTVKHHLKILEECGFISSSKNRYGSTYQLTQYFRSHKFFIKVKWAAPNPPNLMMRLPSIATSGRAEIVPTVHAVEGGNREILT